MPRVILGAAAKSADREAKMDSVLAGAVGRYCAANKKRQYDVAQAVGITRGPFSQWMRNFGNVKLRDVRRIAHAVEMTPEEWLRLGGFKS